MFKHLKSVGLLLGLATCGLASSALADTTGDNGSHDPSRMIVSEGKVYIYSTGGGGKSSPDGLNWKSVGSPPWNRSLLPNNQGIWAPDGLFWKGRYLLYGSMWNDSKASALVLLSSPTLNPDSPNYKWTDHGVVVAGPAGVQHSVIDPAPVVDQEGNLWVVWGGGYPFPNEADSIILTRLDNETGLALTTDPGYKPPNLPGYALKQGHKEGPYIHFHDGFYYLFYQTGSCCSGTSSTYLIHVARSASIKGPYTGDKNFYASQGDVHGPGHMGIYEQCGESRFTYHYYPSNGSIIGENALVWGADGWPSVGPESTTPLKICDTPGSGAGGSSGMGGSATAGAAGAAAGSGGHGGMVTGGGDTGGGQGGATTGGVANSAGMANVSGSQPVAGTSPVAGSSSSSGSGNDLDETPDGNDAYIGCVCTLPASSSGTERRAGWLAAVAFAVAAWRRRRG